MTQPLPLTSDVQTSGAPTIGVFDSGFGGLTVLRALIAQFPAARFVFLGDTARLPYGSKSRRTIARYAAESAQFLVRDQAAQFLVIACNTASALALDSIKAAIQDAVPPVPVLGVITPGAEAARAASRTGDVLVLATDATVQSHAYSAACHALGLRALEKACPLLVPLVEEGWLAGSPDSHLHPATPHSQITAGVLRIYLAELLAEADAQGLQPDTLVLGCTHYPLLRPLLDDVLAQLLAEALPGRVPHPIRIIDSAAAVAQAAHLQLGLAPDTNSANPADSANPANSPNLRCFATDSVEKFARLGPRFLNHPVGPVQLVDLGG
jgi:glutamate racemase